MSEAHEVHVEFSLVLSTPEAKELYNQLSSDGLLSEFLSDLFNERATGIAANEFKSMNSTLLALQKQIEGLMAGVTRGAGPLAAPTVDHGVIGGSKQEDVVETIKINPSKMKGNDILNRMKKMGRK